MMREETVRNELLAEVDAISPVLASHALTSEQLGRLDDPSFEAVQGTRLLKMFCPAELGGLETDPVTAMLALEALARIDGAASWTVGILGSSILATACLPAAALRRIFGSGVPPVAGSFFPKGVAEPVAGGYRVSGRWPFASGIHHAKWIVAGCAVPDQPPPAGPRLVVLPREQVVIQDNWRVAGLKGTGSCDFSIDNIVVAEEMTCPLMNMIMGNATMGGAAIKLGLPAGVASFHIGIPLGIARHALDEITTQAVEKGRGFPPSALQSQPHFQFALGKAEIELASARALALQLMTALWADAQANGTPSPPRQAEIRAASTFITELAQRVTGTALQAAGGGGLFDDNPLQRCFRDVAAAGQHFAVSQTAYQALGQFKLKRPDANPML